MRYRGFTKCIINRPDHVVLVVFVKDAMSITTELGWFWLCRDGEIASTFGTLDSKTST